MVMEQHMRQVGRGCAPRGLRRRQVAGSGRSVPFSRRAIGTDLPTTLSGDQPRYGGGRALPGVIGDGTGVGAATPPFGWFLREERYCLRRFDSRAQARRVLEYIESNLEREITLRELSGILDLSPYHF